jgi:hypothetical protein
MNVVVDRHIAGTRDGFASRRSRAIARAWRSLRGRDWLIALGVGLFMGAFDAMFMILYSYRGMPEPLRARGSVLIVTRWMPLMVAVACALAFGLALLRDRSRRAAIRPRDVALTIAGVAAFGSLVVDPIVGAFHILQYHWLGMPERHWLEGVSWSTALSRLYSLSGEKILTFVTTVTLAAVYYWKDSRTSDALAVTQLGLSRAQKRRLTEELRSAQASLDPEFLFATLAETDRRFESDPLSAQRLLDALIRYLRAALPAKDDVIGTLGQQATLVRAYLDIQTIRSAGRSQWVIDVPGDLERRLFAPALILPLVAHVCGDATDSGRDTEILVKAVAAAGWLTIEVRVHGCEPLQTAETEATLASLRQRLAALYGSGAELSCERRSPRRVAARIVIDDPGDL